jgi:hypothetical protein
VVACALASVEPELFYVMIGRTTLALAVSKQWQSEKIV